MSKKVSGLKKDQQGVVAIVVSVMLMLIMSLIALSISQNTQREQRQSLDRQLSDQAFYNAETGINDTAAYLYNNPGAPIDKTTCAVTSELSGNIDGGVNKYTCLLYDKAPKNILYDNISTSEPRVVPINSANQAGSPVNLSSLTIKWDDSSDRNGQIQGDCSFDSGSPKLPPNCDYGGLRLELISPSENRQLIQQRSFISFLLPNATTGSDISISDAFYPNNQGIISATRCDGPEPGRRCTKTIKDINRNNLFLSLRSLYRPVNVTISGKDGSGNDVRFVNTQTMVDSTGKASDVLRRLQVRIPATSQYSYPGFALQSKDSICKVLNVTKNDTSAGVGSADPTNCPTN